MKKQVTLGQLISVGVVIVGGLIAILVNNASTNAKQDTEIQALKQTQSSILWEQKTQTKLLVSIDATLKAKGIKN